MSVSVSTTNKPLNPRAQDLSPKGYNRAALYSGKALDFDGVNDQVIVNGINNLFDYGNSYTMAGCFKIVHTASGSLMGNSNGNSFANLLGFVYKSGEDSNFYPDGNSSNHITIYSGNTTDFVHIVCTSDGTTAKAYLNGQLVGSTSVSSYTNTSSRFNVGSSYSGNFGENEAAGVKVFNVALTAAQVADLYLNPEKIVPDGVADSALKLWLPMMEGVGTTAYDGSGNGNHGTISGATWVSGIGAPVAQTALVSWNKGTNLVQYSEQFDNAVYNKTGVSVTTNSAIGPDGSLTADTLTAVIDGTLYILQNGTPISGKSYVQTVFAKAGTTDFLQMTFGTSCWGIQHAIFNLSNGTIDTESNIDATISDAGNGWYKCSITKTTTTSTTSALVILLPSYSGAPRFDGHNGDSVYIWGASTTESSTLQPYIPTLATTQTSPVLLPQGLTANKDITGVNAFESARNPYALNLDGFSWAEVHDNASLDFGSGSWSMECWFYWDGTSNGDGILSRWYATERAMLLYTQSGSYIRLFTGRTSGSADYDISSSTISIGWRHIVGTYDSSDTKLRIYIDGALDVASAAFAGAYNSNAQSLEIGRLNNDANGTYTNDIALPRIYNRALTATEVARNYNADKSKFGL